MTSLVGVAVTFRRVTSGSMIETETFLLSNELREVREFEDHFRVTGVDSEGCSAAFPTTAIGFSIGNFLNAGVGVVSTTLLSTILFFDTEVVPLSTFGLLSIDILSTLVVLSTDDVELFRNLDKLGEVFSTSFVDFFPPGDVTNISLLGVEDVGLVAFEVGETGGFSR